MAADAEFVFNLAPELSSEKTSRVDFFIEQAKLSVNSDVFGTKADLAVGLLAAHMLTVSNRSGAAGAITEEKVGEVSVKFDVGGSKDDRNEDLRSTGYGLQFLRLRRSIVRTPMLAGG